jgi:hypothetical protein
MMRQVAFDRMLARLFVEAGRFYLKGGYAFELRLDTARTTRDIDLTFFCPAGTNDGSLNPEEFQLVIQSLCNQDMGDTFKFRIDPATRKITGTPYGGARFPVEARMDGRTFVSFHIDVGFGDLLVGHGESICGRDWLGFAGIPAPRILCISNEQQFAEKLHAYTMPVRLTPNSRVKDLVDMVLLLTRFELDKSVLIRALQGTYKQRNTHDLTRELNPPPVSWTAPFADLAGETNLGLDIHESFNFVQDYLVALLSD